MLLESSSAKPRSTSTSNTTLNKVKKAPSGLAEAISKAAEKARTVAKEAQKPASNNQAVTKKKTSDRPPETSPSTQFASTPRSERASSSTWRAALTRSRDPEAATGTPDREETPARVQSEDAESPTEARSAIAGDTEARAEVEAETEASEEPADNRTEFERHAEVLDTYFDVFDNPDGGTDGRSGDGDIEDLARGDYDRDDARERLLDQGVAADEVDDVIEQIEETARYFDENEDSLARVDGGNDGGDVDGRFSRGDLDVVLEETRNDRRQELSDGDALEILEEHFEVFDNPGDGGTDGKISDGDLRDLVEGDYDRAAARERLREAGVAEEDLNDALGRIESSAQHLLEGDTDLYDDLDVANDSDRDHDGDIRRGDLDRYVLDHRPEVDEDFDPFQPSQEEVEGAQEAYQRFVEPGALEETLADRPLSEFDGGELLAVAQLSQEDPELQGLVGDAVLEAVETAESLDELPGGTGFQYLLGQHVNGTEGEAAQHLESLVNAELEARLSDRLNDRRGDGEADVALERFGADVEDLLYENPALGQLFIDQAGVVAEGQAGRITDVRRADDSALSKVGHAVTGGIRAGAGFIGDGLRQLGEIAGTTFTAPLRIAGEVADFGLTAVGEVAGAGLDLVGADGLADDVRNGSAALGDLADGATDFLADQNQNFINGFVEGAAGTVEGVAQVVTNPVGTVQGIAALIEDPSLLLDSYGEILDEHGVAGLVGNIGFDVLTTVATGGGSAGASVSARLARTASFLDDFGRAGSLTGRVTTGAARALGQAERVGFRVTDNLGNAVDNISGRLGRNLDLPNGLTDELGSLDDVLGNARLLDEQAEALGRANPDALVDGIDGGRVVAGNRQQAVEFLAERFPDVSLDRINRWVNSDAAAGAEVAIVQAPAGTRVARGFNAAADARAALQGSFDDLFQGNAFADGGYFNLASDVDGVSRGALRSGNAVPVHNAGDRFVIRELTEDEFFLASRVAGQRGAANFGPLTGGGFRQYRFLGDHDILPVVDEFSPPNGLRPTLPGLALASLDTIEAAYDSLEDAFDGWADWL